MRKITSLITLALMLTGSAGGAQAQEHADSLTLDLATSIRMAQDQSPAAQSARSSFLSAYWNYRYFRANYLPSVTLQTSPYLNKEINKITQQDGTSQFIKQDEFSADATIKINQNIALTGGSLFLTSKLTRLDDLRNDITAYSSQPLTIGYQQSIFGYNSLKWDKLIEPRRYSEARKNYSETLELISAETCNRFFALASALNDNEMARQNFAASDSLYNMARGRYNIGTISENEMLQLEINRLNDENTVMDSQIALEDQMQSFRSYLGIGRQTRIGIVIPDSVPEFQVPVDRAMTLAQQNSPDPEYYDRLITEYKSHLAQAKANAGLKADIYMQLGLSQTGKDIATAYSDPNNQMLASVTVSLPILDWGRGRGRVRVAKSQLETINTQAEQGMMDFQQNIQKIVMQFNMQSRKVAVAQMTSQRAEQRNNVARKLYMMGRNSILDLNSAISEKNNAKRNYISTMLAYWRLYYTIRSITGYDFEHNTEITNQLPI